MTPRRPTTVNEFDLFRVTDLLLYLKNNARQPKSTLINLELRHNKVNGELKINTRHVIRVRFSRDRVKTGLVQLNLGKNLCLVGSIRSCGSSQLELMLLRINVC